jgi:hypothetical protein
VHREWVGSQSDVAEEQWAFVAGLDINKHWQPDAPILWESSATIHPVAWWQQTGYGDIWWVSIANSLLY